MSTTVRDPKAFLDSSAAEFYELSGLAGRSGPGIDEMKWLVTASPVRPTERCWDWKRETLEIQASLEARGWSYNGYPVSADYFGSYSWLEPLKVSASSLHMYVYMCKALSISREDQHIMNHISCNIYIYAIKSVYALM